MADPNEKLGITLHIYDMNMSVRVKREDEELYRKMAQLITEVMGNYANTFKGLKSEKEIHYMALVDIAMRYGFETKRNDVGPLMDEISKFDQEIKDALSDQ